MVKLKGLETERWSYNRWCEEYLGLLVRVISMDFPLDFGSLWAIWAKKPPHDDDMKHMSSQQADNIVYLSIFRLQSSVATEMHHQLELCFLFLPLSFLIFPHVPPFH